MKDRGEKTLIKRPFQFLAFILALSILIIILKILNWIPLALDRDIMRKYASIEEVRGTLKVNEILVPSYFPQRLKWPPSEILAQGKPYPAIVMEFRDIERGDVNMIIIQAGSPDFRADEKIRITDVKERADHTMKGRDAHLEVGSCQQGEPCSRISWDEGELRVEIILKSPPFELIKIAESMIR
jgi:hypothetical protein